MLIPHSSQPSAQDAVLGGQAAVPVGSLILGGLEGVKRRLNSAIAPERVAAIREAVNYGTAGLKLVTRLLDDPSLSVQKAAYACLRDRPERFVKKALKAFNLYPLVDCLYSLTGHQGGITAIALSPDGKTLISSSRDRTIRVWDLDAREEQFVIHEPSLIFTITLCPDEQLFITKSNDHFCKIWSLRNGQAIDLPWDDLETVRPRSIASVTLTTGHHLISGSQNTIRIWNLQHGKEVRVLRGHTSLVSAVAVNPDPLLLASGSEDRTIKLWGVG